MPVTINGTTGIAGVDGSASTPSYQGTDTNTGIFFPAADTIAFGEGGAEVMRIDSSGNVGIGTTAPDSKLSIDHSSTSTSVLASYANIPLLLQNTSSTDNNWSVIAVQDASGDFSSYIGTQNTSQSSNTAIMAFATNSGSGATERMRIDSSGNLLVGTTATLGLGGGPLQVSGSSNTIASKCSTTDATMISWNATTSGNGVFIGFGTEGTYTARGNIDYNRGAGQVRYNTTSDATLKNILGDSDGQKSVEILNSTRIREYAWKDDETQKPQIGVIAQELHETFKGAVSVGGGVEKTDEDGNVTTEYHPWSVDKTAFTFHLIAGWQVHEKLIQELKAITDAQATRIETLEAQNAAFEARLAALEAK